MALQPFQSLTSPRAGVLAPVTSARHDLPRYERSLVTQRCIQTTEEAFTLVYEPPATHQKVAWMGNNKTSMAVASSSFDYRTDAKMRADARERRARTMREMRSFLDDVESTIKTASQATAGRPRSSAARPPSTSPSRTATASQARRSPSSATPNTTPSTPSHQQRQKKSGGGSATDGDSRSRSPSFQRASGGGGGAESLSASMEVQASSERSRVASGDLVVSAFDGTIHEVYEITAYNAFVHDRMLEILRDEEAREAEGELFSCSSSVQASPTVAGAGSSQTSPHALSGSLRHATRRPAQLPDVDRWNEQVPTETDANGNPLEESAVAAARTQYNADAAANAKSLMAYRVFRTRRFEREFQELQRGNA